MGTYAVCESSCGDCGPHARSFLTKEEKIEKLQKYHDMLKKEAQGVAEKIDDLKKSE